MLKSGLLTCAALLAATPLLADPMAISATSVSTDKSQFIATGDGSGVFHLMFENQPFVTDDPASPLAGLTGNCFGLGTLVAGLMSGEGYCDMADPAGDKVLIRWSMAPSATPQGAWQFAGGSGKWATAMGGGFFFDTPTETEGVATGHISGQVEFK